MAPGAQGHLDWGTDGTRILCLALTMMYLLFAAGSTSIVAHASKHCLVFAHGLTETRLSVKRADTDSAT